jgi:anti-anti-sigma regulatory factor
VGIENYLEDVLLVTLSAEPHLGSELDEITEMISEGCNRDVIVDFAMVDMLISESICALMILDKYLCASEHQLVFYNTSPEIMHIFNRTGLATVFTFADDEYGALQAVRRPVCMC